MGTNLYFATLHDYYMALSYTIRDRLVHRRLKTAQTYSEQDAKIVYYLSLEYLMGCQLGNNLINVGLYERSYQALREFRLSKPFGFSLEDLMAQEEEPGLGNGGLGRLAACFLDSLATLEIPAVGHGIRYEFGIFNQTIRDGWQMECPDKWLSFGSPWEIPRLDYRVEIQFGGRTETSFDKQGRYRVCWHPEWTVLGTPYDMLVPGYGTNTVNTLRLWKAEASEALNFQAFNAGDYIRAVASKTLSENISKVLYPNENTLQGRRLRLEQQYFFVSCALQDIIRTYRLRHQNFARFPDRVAIQLNDTHPVVAVAELMRLLLDVYELEWNQAWSITQRTFAYTNHTLLPESLERWPVGLFGRLLPRTFIFGGKAAPGYHMAKLIIKLIHSVAELVNHDPDVRGRLTVVFLVDYNVSLGQQVYPAADLSEQISTAGMEASGTGNMKFAMNGALTIGTLDGANVEIRSAVGPENFFLFGLTAEEVADLRGRGYHPWGIYNTNPELQEVIHRLAAGDFSPQNRNLFSPIVDALLQQDEYLLLADYQAYIDCQEQVSQTYQDQETWTRKSILNVARTAYFSSDRTIQEYAAEIWKVKPVKVKLEEEDLEEIVI
ncbi:MAG: glycogen/starch/alpha-glucan phosphorylase [Leptolyngbyaceae cyanobacterium]